jgi:hypothetical protein
MQKTVLSLSVAAALAVPTLASAQAPAVPTLDKIFESSGISVSGHIDAGYMHANRDIENGFSTRVFDTDNNSFVLRQVGLQVAKQPKEGFGGLVNITAGHDAKFLHSAPEGTGATTSTWDLTQAYAQYATGPVTVIAGKYVTMHGTEVIASPGNANISRSILFGSVPFTHTGLRGTYAVMDSLSVMAGVNNGWDQLTDNNKGKTLELGLTSSPIKPLSITASYMRGEEAGTVTDVSSNQLINGTRDSINLVAGYNIMDPLSVGFEYLRVSQKDAVSDGAGGTKSATYSGFAGYLSYTFMPKMKLSLRAESLNDKDGFRFPTAATIAGTTGTKHKEFTVTLAYMAADNFELRGEVRNDRADQAVYTDGSNMSKSLLTYAIQGLYKF